MGNLSENPKAFIFLMDYAHSRRVKLWGTARAVEDDPALIDQLRDPSYPGEVERAILFTIEAWDVNCPQHIHQRFSQGRPPGAKKCCYEAEKIQKQGGSAFNSVRNLGSRILRGNAVVKEFFDLARLVRSLQRLEGKPQCFGTGQPTCEGICCAWRQYCLKFEVCTVSYSEQDFDKIYG